MAEFIPNNKLPDVVLIEPRVFGDERGFFLESYNQRLFNEKIGREVNFVQDNHSRSARNVLRGLHLQVVRPQGKLVRVLSGVIFDVVVDLRPESPSFGTWISEELSSDNFKQLWIPEGFAHGFMVLTDQAEISYKTTEFWYPEYERVLKWNDPSIGIDWPLIDEPILSERDESGLAMEELIDGW